METSMKTKWNVVTANGLVVFSSTCFRSASAYVKQASAKGSPVGFLTVVKEG